MQPATGSSRWYTITQYRLLKVPAQARINNVPYEVVYLQVTSKLLEHCKVYTGICMSSKPYIVSEAWRIT